MNTIYWLLVIAVLIAMTFAGWIRPTGLLGRTRAEQEQENRRDAAAKWLEKDGEQAKGPQNPAFFRAFAAVRGRPPSPEMAICDGLTLDFRRFGL